MNRKEMIIVVMIILGTFIGGVYASANVPSIQQVLVTNFPSNQKVTVSNPQNVTVNVQSTQASKQIILYQGNIVGLGYKVNQSSTYASSQGIPITFNRTYVNPFTYNLYFNQYFRIVTNATFNMNYQFQFIIGSGGCCGGTISSTTVYAGSQSSYLGISFYVTPGGDSHGTTTVAFTFNIPSGTPLSVRIDLLATQSSGDNVSPAFNLPYVNATGYRRLTIHAYATSNFTVNSAITISVSEVLFDPTTGTQFTMNVINISGCGIISYCNTYEVYPPFIAQGTFYGVGDFYNVKIVAYVWN